MFCSHAFVITQLERAVNLVRGSVNKGEGLIKERKPITEMRLYCLKCGKHKQSTVNRHIYNHIGVIDLTPKHSDGTDFCRVIVEK